MMERFHHWKTTFSALENKFGHTPIFLVPFPRKKAQKSWVIHLRSHSKLNCYSPKVMSGLKSLSCKHVRKQTEINWKRPHWSRALFEQAVAMFSPSCCQPGSTWIWSTSVMFSQKWGWRVWLFFSHLVLILVQGSSAFNIKFRVVAIYAITRMKVSREGVGEDIG